MLAHVINYLRCWLAERHPRLRRARQKRRLEELLQAEGLTRSAARRITVEAFRD